MSQLMTKTLSGLYNGVSQQAQTMRLETQHTEQVNFDSTIVDGLYKRPGTRWITKLMNSYGYIGTYFSSIVRDENEAYVFMITPNGYIQVWDKNGVSRPVVYGYMNFTDYSYAADDSVRANYLGNQTKIARSLFDTMTVADYTFISRSDRSPSMTADVAGGTIKDSYQSFNDLQDSKDADDNPLAWTAGEMVHIEGDPDKKQDEFWVCCVRSSAHNNNKPAVFQECCQPGTQTTLNKYTMPHALVRAPDGTFVFTPLEWGQRQVGNDETNPVPSFVGSYIKQMFFYRNRLGFLTPTGLVMSKPGDYFELFSLSSLDVIDSDPIDESANTRQVTNLHKTEVMGRNLILYSDRQQFTVHSNDDPMSPTTIQIDPGTTYETDENSQTTTCGASAFFISPKGKWADLMEYEDVLAERMEDASTVTSHCPEFIPNGYIKMLSSPADSMVIIHSESAPNSLWIYRYQIVQDTKAQSAFSEWRFHDPIEGIAMIDSDLVMLQRIDGGLVMVKVNLEAVSDYDLGWHIRLDRGTSVPSVCYDPDARTALIAPPFSQHPDTVVVDATNGRAVSNFEWVDGYIRLSNVNGLKWYMVGLNITGWVTLSPWYIKTNQGTAVIDGRLQIRSMAIQYQQTGYFQVEIQNEGRDARIEEWTNNIIGKMKYGNTQLFDGKFKTGVRGRNTTTTIKIKSTSYLPVKIAAVGYEGLFVQRARAL